MFAHLVAPALLAILAALLVAYGTLVRQRASTPTGGITKRWWLGVFIASLGFFAQAVALGLGSLLLVSPLIVLSVLFALPMEAHYDHRRLNRHEWKWGFILTAAIALFVVITRPQPAGKHVELPVLAVTLAIVAVIIAAVCLIAKMLNKHWRAMVFGIASGLLTGVQALLVKIVATQVGEGGLLAALTNPELYLIVVVAVGAVITQQMAFAAHDLQTSFPAMTVVEPAAAMALGVILLKERVDVNAWEGVVVGVVWLLMMIAVVILARHAAEREVAGEQQAPRNEPIA